MSLKSADRPEVASLPKLNVLGQTQRLALTLGLCLVLVDLGLIGLHLVAKSENSINLLLYIDIDRSYAEALQGLKYLFTTAFLACAAFLGKLWPIMLWIPAFLAFLIDDLLAVHENIGWHISQQLPPVVWGFQGQDIGELCVYLAGVLVIGLPILIAYRQGKPLTRWAYRVLGVLAALLAFFGAGVDMVHSAFTKHASGLDAVFAVIEDGGEMLVMTCFVSFAAYLATLQAEPQASSQDS